MSQFVHLFLFSNIVQLDFTFLGKHFFLIIVTQIYSNNNGILILFKFSLYLNKNNLTALLLEYKLCISRASQISGKLYLLKSHSCYCYYRLDLNEAFFHEIFPYLCAVFPQYFVDIFMTDISQSFLNYGYLYMHLSFLNQEI